MKTKLLDFYRRTSNYWFLFFYYVLVLLVLAVAFVVYDKFLVSKPIEVKSNILDIENINKRIESLEKQIQDQNRLLEKQAITIKWFENNHEGLMTNTKIYERRLQAHTEFLKRTCEYINVITVDKKILPRQCLPEYNWRREDGDKLN